MFDKFKDECGVFGVFGDAEAANLTYLGLHALQHRGQEGAGIVASNGAEQAFHRGVGLVADVFDERSLAGLPGDSAIGHVRYSTAGGADPKNLQPFSIRWAGGSLAVAHNGNLVNADALKKELEASGAIFQSTSDTEVVIHLVARCTEGDLTSRVVQALQRVKGAYSLLFLSEKQMIGVRDPLGFRPLVLGRRKNSYVLASETCALDLIEAEYIREIEPGEMVVVDASGLRSLRPFGPSRLGRCIFEYIYFARPDSVLFGANVHAVRKDLGRQLARENPVEADVVIGVPDSGTPAALGYAEASGIGYDQGLIRSHYVGRTFIEPQASIRHFGVKLKLSAVQSVLQGKRVVVVDDSIVRGTTSRKIVKMLRGAGAKEVHLRISSPPTRWPCYYGIDTPTRQELIASSHSVDEIAKYVTADSLGYLSMAGLKRAVGESATGPSTFCDACFSGDYLVELNDKEGEPRRLLAQGA